MLFHIRLGIREKYYYCISNFHVAISHVAAVSYLNTFWEVGRADQHWDTRNCGTPWILI